MAAVTLLGSATFNTTSGTKTVTATPAANDLIVLVTAHSGNTSSTAPTDNNSDGLGSYTQIGTGALKASSADVMRFWVRNSLIGSASSTVFTHAPGASSGGGVAVLKITGMSVAGSLAIRQSAKQENQASATPAPAFSSAAQTTNAIIGAVFNATSAAGLTPRGTPAYSERVDVGYSTPTTGLEIMTIDSGETGSTITWGGSSASAFSSFVVEIDAGAKNTSLTGQAVTASAGSLAGGQPLSGQAVTASAGTLVAGQPLVGQAVTVSTGTLTAEVEQAARVTFASFTTPNPGNASTAALTGSEVTSGAGTLSHSRTVTLTGQAVTTSVGTITPSPSITLNGESVTITAGLLPIASGASVMWAQMTVPNPGPTGFTAISGSSATFSTGTLTPVPRITPTSQVVTVSDGTLTPSRTVALTGQAVTVSAGTIQAPSNSTVTWAQFVIPAPQSIGITPTSQVVTVSAGTLTPNRTVALSGTTVTVSAGTLLSNGNAAQVMWAQLRVPMQPNPNVDVSLTGSVVSSLTGTIGYSKQDSQSQITQPGPGVNPFNNNQFLPAPRATSGVVTSPDRGQSLFGQAVTVSDGTVVPVISVALTGEVVTASAGTMTAAFFSSWTSSGGLSLGGRALWSSAFGTTGGISFGGSTTWSTHEGQKTWTASGGISFSGLGTWTAKPPTVPQTVYTTYTLRRFVGRR